MGRSRQRLVLNRETGELRARGGQPVRLTPQLHRVLLVLSELQPSFVGVEELLERAWKGTHVGEGSAREAIRRLREALGDSEHELIEQRGGWGYRLSVPLRFADEGRQRSRRRAAGIAVLATFGVVLIGALMWRAPAPSAEPVLVHLSDGGYGFRSGRAGVAPLWDPLSIRLRVDDRLEERIAGFSQPAAVRRDSRHDVWLFEPGSGRRVEVVAIPSGARFFQQRFSDRFAPSLRVRDIDGDGEQELLVVNLHVLRPSYTVLYDSPRPPEVVFAGQGHYWPAGSLDVDSDGTAELLLAGVANQFGYLGSLAAVRIGPRAKVLGQDQARVVATTPDDRPFRPTLLWFAVLPPGICESCVAVDQRTGIIEVRPRSGGRIRLDRYGLRINEQALPIKERLESRRRALDCLRLAGEREALIGSKVEGAVAIELLEEAASAARRAGEPELALWAEVARARAYVRAGDRSRGLAELERLSEGTVFAADVAFQAADALHLAGRVEESIPWYWKALGHDPSLGFGRPRWKIVEGLVLARGELGSWDAAARDIDLVARSVGVETSHEIEPAPYQAYIRWRTSGERRGYEPEVRMLDLQRYWGFELLWTEVAATGDLVDDRKLLGRLEADRRWSYEYEALFDSLRGEIRFALGDREEALELARSAFDAVRLGRRSSVGLRAHSELVAERLVRMLRSSAWDEAADIEAEAGSWD